MRVPPINDFVIAWTEGTPGQHDKKPILASQYLLGLELALEKQISENGFSDGFVVRTLAGDTVIVYREQISEKDSLEDDDPGKAWRLHH